MTLPMFPALVSSIVGPYACTVIDPPWPYEDGFPVGWGGVGGRRPLPYASMSVEGITALDFRDIFQPESYVFVWATDRYLSASLDVLTAWRLTRRQTWVWAKSPRGSGPGGLAATTCEFLHVCQRIGPKSNARRKWRLPHAPRPDSTWFGWPTGGHSQKPEAMQDLLERVLPGPRLEVFARRVRPGWRCVGNEIDGLDVNAALGILRQESR